MARGIDPGDLRERSGVEGANMRARYPPVTDNSNVVFLHSTIHSYLPAPICPPPEIPPNSHFRCRQGLDRNQQGRPSKQSENDGMVHRPSCRIEIEAGKTCAVPTSYFGCSLLAGCSGFLEPASSLLQPMKALAAIEVIASKMSIRLVIRVRFIVFVSYRSRFADIMDECPKNATKKNLVFPRTNSTPWPSTSLKCEKRRVVKNTRA